MLYIFRSCKQRYFNQQTFRTEYFNKVFLQLKKKMPKRKKKKPPKGTI